MRPAARKGGAIGITRRLAQLVKRAMECDFSWSNSAKSYEGLYNEVVNLW